MDSFGFIVLLGCCVQFADLLDLLAKRIPVLNVGVLPVSTAVWL